MTIEKSASRYRVGVDIGGTFTDLVILDERTGTTQTLKVSSTPSEPSRAVFEALRRARDDRGLAMAEVGQFTHATTVASNTILERLGAKTALLVTDGFRDVLEIQRHKRYRLFDAAYSKIPPLVPRRFVYGIPERLDAAGNVVLPLNDEAVRAAADAIAEAGIEAVAICFLFSFQNQAHECTAADILRKRLPKVFITLSSEIYPQYREYERASTTVVNAMLGPRVSAYLTEMSKALVGLGITAPLHLMQSNGGIIGWEDAGRIPCRIVESGPASGVIAAAYFGAAAGRENLIAFDMGGTTAKAGLVENGIVRQSSGQEVGAGINISRLLQGGGYFIGAPTVDLAEVGAGGGSIAWLDQSSVLKVGPKSAGADPGPIAYGLGGTQVTVTDANLLLGRIPAEYFLGGELHLDLQRATEIVEESIARPLGISVEDACVAIVEVANASMLKMLRIITVEKGLDPRDFSLVAFGGGGPVHAAALASELGMREVIVPPAPGLLSAQGLLVAEIRHDFRQTHVGAVEMSDFSQITMLFETLEARGRVAFAHYGLPDDAISARWSADLRYRRQAYEIAVPLESSTIREGNTQEIVRLYHETHERLYGRTDEAGIVEFVNLCVTTLGNVRRPDFKMLPSGSRDAQQARKPNRDILFPEAARVDCACYDRALLLSGDVIVGPAIIEAADSTTVVPPEWDVRCDEIGNLFLTRKP
jgi:N-methylhydantoinase A